MNLLWLDIVMIIFVIYTYTHMDSQDGMIKSTSDEHYDDRNEEKDEKFTVSSLIEKLKEIYKDHGDVPILIQDDQDIGTIYVVPEFINILNVKYKDDGYYIESSKSSERTVKALCLGII